MYINSVVVGGYLTDAPEISRTQGGAQCATMRIAVNEPVRGGEERTTFVTVKVWGKQSDFCRNYLRKGLPALVSGVLREDSWQGKDGERRRAWYVLANNVQLLAWDNTGGGQAAQTRQTAIEDSDIPDF